MYLTFYNISLLLQFELICELRRIGREIIFSRLIYNAVHRFFWKISWDSYFNTNFFDKGQKNFVPQKLSLLSLNNWAKASCCFPNAFFWSNNDNWAKIHMLFLHKIYICTLAFLDQIMDTWNVILCLLVETEITFTGNM